MCKSLFGFIFKTGGEGDPAQEEPHRQAPRCTPPEKGRVSVVVVGWSAPCEGATVSGMEGEQRQCV